MNSSMTPTQAHIASELLRAFETGEARLITLPKSALGTTRPCRVVKRAFADRMGVLIADAEPPAPPVTAELGPTLDALWRTVLGQLPPDEICLVVALGEGHYTLVELRVCAASGSLIATRWKPVSAPQRHLEEPHV